MKMLTVRLSDDDDYYEFAQKCKNNRTTISRVVRKLIDEYVKGAIVINDSVQVSKPLYPPQS